MVDGIQVLQLFLQHLRQLELRDGEIPERVVLGHHKQLLVLDVLEHVLEGVKRL